jgi:magnesium-transporting ATPase (P-type)
MALRAYGWLGLIEAALALGGFFAVYLAAGWRPGELMVAEGPLYTTATTMTLLGIVAGQVGAAFACRSTRQSIFQVGFTSNRVLLGGIALEVLLLVGLVYVPMLASLFELAPLPLPAWGAMFLFGPVLLLLEEGRKLIWRRSRRA